DKSVICTITVGNVSTELGIKEKFIRSVTHRKTKNIEQMYSSSDVVPAWFLSGMKSVQLAPSAVNRQPVMFSYAQAGTVTASVKNITDDGFALDLGIAKLHFELGADGGTWDFGNGARFRKDI
ncbi:MAG: nitroreductase, partial [Dehalococcoidia bacterium]|nr:nitroreductase [Dehalococcoidia bacterium]